MGYDGRTALMAAARNGHCAVVLALLGARADLTPRSEDGFGSGPVHEAVLSEFWRWKLQRLC